MPYRSEQVGTHITSCVPETVTSDGLSGRTEYLKQMEYRYVDFNQQPLRRKFPAKDVRRNYKRVSLTSSWNQNRLKMLYKVTNLFYEVYL